MMARINVEKRFFTDPRFVALGRMIGNSDQALGMCVRAWGVALDFWSDGERLIPPEIWNISDFDLLLKVGLAELRPEGVYCRGTELRLNWINELAAKRSEAGKASAKARKAKFGTSVPPHAYNFEQTEQTTNTCSNTFEQNPTNGQQTVNTFERSLLSSLSSLHMHNSIPQGPNPGAEPPPDRETPFDHETARRWLEEHAVLLMPRLKPKLADWARAIRLLREQDGLSEADITEILSFVRRDEFWGKNALSPLAIRGKSKSNGLRKFENIMLAMKKKTPETKANPRPMHRSPLVNP